MNADIVHNRAFRSTCCCAGVKRMCGCGDGGQNSKTFIRLNVHHLPFLQSLCGSLFPGYCLIGLPWRFNSNRFMRFGTCSPDPTSPRLLHLGALNPCVFHDLDFFSLYVSTTIARSASSIQMATELAQFLYYNLNFNSCGAVYPMLLMK